MGTDNIKYERLRGCARAIALACDCSPSYVTKVLQGNRNPKTDRAELAKKIFLTADKMLATLTEFNNKHNN